MFNIFCTLQGYVLKLTSSLSTSTYDYTLPEVQFTANVSYRHFTLRFDVQVGVTVITLSFISFTYLPLLNLAQTCSASAVYFAGKWVGIC